MQSFLLKILGRRIAVLFGGICFSSVAVLAALYLSSGYALSAYVADQIDRLPWDVTVLQKIPLHTYPELQARFGATTGISRVEGFGFLRLQSGTDLRFEVDGRQPSVRWLGILAASDTSLLPAALRPTTTRVPSNHDARITVPTAFVTSRKTSEDADDIDAGSVLRLVMGGDVEETPQHTHGPRSSPHGHDTAPRDEHLQLLFEAIANGRPANIERLEFNKWVLDRVGSLTYLPEPSIVLIVPMSVYESIAKELDEAFFSTEGMHGVERAPPYLPEIAHLLRIDRGQWLSTWDLRLSIANLQPLLMHILAEARSYSPNSILSSDLRRLLLRMDNVSRSIGMVTLLVAIPLLWLIWVVSRMLSNLLFLNERRLIGLARIRGVSLDAISNSLLLALLIGGLAGSLLGLFVGIGLPVLGHSMAGEPAPPLTVLMRGLAYFAGFVGLGLLLAAASGRSIINRIRKMTPRETIARVAGNDADSLAEQASTGYIMASICALLLGSYKIASWIADRPLLEPSLQGSASDTYFSALLVSESLLNFIAVPLFLFGVTGVMRWRVKWFQPVLSALIAPFVGKLRWFVVEHMLLARYRIATAMFVTALAVSLTLLPQVAADSFYDRVLRGITASLGGDLHLEYALSELAGGKDDPAPVPEYSVASQSQVLQIEEALLDDARVENVVRMEQFIIPGVYLPTQTGLMLNLVEDPDAYGKNVYFEESLGLTQPFSNILSKLSGESLTISQGFRLVRDVPLDRDVLLAYEDESKSISVQFGDVVAYLPGQPSIDVAQREGYLSEEVDYLNYVTISDARVIASTARFSGSPLNSLSVLPSRVAFIVNTHVSLDAELIEDLVAGLPIQPQTVRWQAHERRQASKDMFISLALGNLKVFMLGGLVLALVGVIAIGLANFMAERRTFDLLRLRGLRLASLVRISLAMFLVPVLVGIVLGVLLGAVSGHGISQAIWELPRINGVAGLLENRLVFSLTAWSIVAGFSVVLVVVAIAFAVWPFRSTASEAIKERR